jgi:putative tryptophan/tyrosine transport system substrate-binding protein
MRRREFIAVLGGIVAWPAAAWAQQPSRMRRIGVLIGADEGDQGRQANLAEFRTALQNLGWTEERNLHIDVRWAANDASRVRTYAAELVALNPDAIFGDNTFVLKELKQATHTLPIIFARVTEPILNGLVGSLTHPGGNITGFADKELSSLGKLPQIMKEIAPNVKRVGLLANLPPLPNGTVAAAASVNLRPVLTIVHAPREIENAMVALGKEPNIGLIIPTSPFMLMHRKLIIELAARNKLPTIYSLAVYVRDGGLISYGVDQNDQYRGAARYVDRILKGEKPADLPVQLTAVRLSVE